MNDNTQEKKLPIWDSEAHKHLLWRPDRFKPGMRGLTEEDIKQLVQEVEGRFHLAEDAVFPDLAEELREDVSNYKVPCPLCNGKETMRQPCVGAVTGVKVSFPFKCVCTRHRRYFKRWTDPNLVSLDYSGCKMAALMRGDLRNRFRKLNDQNYETIRATVRQFPFHNYLLVGSAGVGKTTLMTALFDQALDAWAQRSFERNLAVLGVWKVAALILAKQQHRYAMQQADKEEVLNTPTVTPEMILTAVSEPNKFKAHVSIDEFDKYKMQSDFQNGCFHSIIDACQSNTGQVVCNSNLDIDQLLAEIQEQYGQPILRRLTDGPRGVYVNFTEGLVYVNNVRHVVGANGEMIPLAGDLLDKRFPGLVERKAGMVSASTTTVSASTTTVASAPQPPTNTPTNTPTPITTGSPKFAIANQPDFRSRTSHEKRPVSKPGGGTIRSTKEQD